MYNNPQQDAEKREPSMVVIVMFSPGGRIFGNRPQWGLLCVPSGYD